jgi:hypothetical protein
MVVYFEYVFIENFCLDFTLLTLSFLLCKTKIAWWKMVISAILGAGFALVYPLLLLPQILLIFLKITAGFLLCLLPFPRIKNKKEWGRYALNAGVFFAVTFLYGGALTALFSAIFPQKTPVFWVVIGFALLSVCTVVIIRKLYEKRKNFRWIYPCKISYLQRTAFALGYLDSGNLASKNGVLVCFLSPDLFYDIFGEEILLFNGKGGGQVCDEMVISTMSGDRKARLILARLEVEISPRKKVETEVYFCPSANMINREYKLLLNAGIIRD